MYVHHPMSIFGNAYIQKQQCLFKEHYEQCVSGIVAALCSLEGHHFGSVELTKMPYHHTYLCTHSTATRQLQRASKQKPLPCNITVASATLCMHSIWHHIQSAYACRMAHTRNNIIQGNRPTNLSCSYGQLVVLTG